MPSLLAFLLLLLTLHSFGQQEFFEHFSNVTASISKTHFSGYEPELNVSGVNITDDTLHILVHDGAGCLVYEGWLQDSSQAVAPGHFSVSFQGESICDWLEEVNLVASECQFTSEDFWNMPLSCRIEGIYLFPYEYEDNGTPIAQFPSITFTSTFTDSFTPEFTVACPSNCGEGTVWDSTIHQCVPDITFPTAPCGQGTVWDPVNEECIIAVPTDTDFDGCVTAGDVLNILATFGTCPPIPEWPDAPADTTWSCGDIVTYFGFDYPTVQIGNQCWFTEHLRNTQYANGDDIPGGLDGVAWDTTQEGAWSIYGEGSSDCYGPCDEVENLDWHGRLYNFEAVTDPRGLCPSGWHAPTADEFTTLVNGLGGFTAAAPQLAMEGAFGGFGTGTTGLDLLPQGWRNPSGYFSLSDAVFLWSSSEGLPNEATYYSMNQHATGIGQISHWFGMSVRCIKD